MMSSGSLTILLFQINYGSRLTGPGTYLAPLGSAISEAARVRLRPGVGNRLLIIHSSGENQLLFPLLVVVNAF